MRFIVIVLLSLWGAAAQAAGTVLVVGDSISAGYGLRQSDSWPSLLAARLEREGFDYNVVNASISGDTTAGGRSRIGAALARHRPAVVIIALGGNDGLRGLPPDKMRENLEAMARAARDAHARVLIAGMRLPPNYGMAYTRQFEQAFAEAARNTRSVLVPFLLDGFAERRDLFQADAIHPTAAAQPLILDNVWPTLRPLLTVKTTKK
ncbi:MAG: arylesterase [Pseudomonadota bacterium]